MMKIRKIVTTTETHLREGGREVPSQLKLCAAAAVIENPWLGGYVEDLLPEVQAQAPELALLLTQEIIEAVGGADRVEAFGKAAIVGLKGEVEHGSAFLHNPYFGNVIRERLQGDQYISYADLRGPAGSRITVGLGHKLQHGWRTHFISHSFAVPDAPAEDELVIAVLATTGGRPFARIGDRTTDPAVKLADFTERAAAIGITL